MNTLITYINQNIRRISLENINNLLLKIINIKGETALSYLGRRNFHQWILSFYGNNNIKYIINENNFPILHSQHSILTDKMYEIVNPIKKANEESDINDQKFINKLNNVDLNKDLISNLSRFFGI